MAPEAVTPWAGNRNEYLEKVYAGVLGKMIGVYLGRPVEGWTFDRIMSELGVVEGYVHDRLGVPLVVTDDDLSGTFTFVRALEDFGDRSEITSAEIGETWLNYLIENKTILWWGGRGTSTEHTAYLNLASGIPAPASGSAALNGSATANQIGAMIFIDGWAMLCPGDPVSAAHFAREAASVSHDLDAVDAAVAIAVMESLAFVETDLQKLLAAAAGFLPAGCAIVRQMEEVNALHRREPDWKVARAWLDAHYGYHKYPGTCHVIPNFSLIVLALLYGAGDFRRSLSIVTTCGWDTDCNAANLGCLLGIRGGLGPIEACADLRNPPSDLMFLVSSDGGRAVTDAAREALALANQHFRLTGAAEEQPCSGARFSFPFKGALHGFHTVTGPNLSPSVRCTSGIRDRAGSLRVDFEAPAFPASVGVPVFIPPECREQPTYQFLASPSLYLGQVITAEVSSAQENDGPIDVSIAVLASGLEDRSFAHRGPVVRLEPGETATLRWLVEVGGDGPILEARLEFDSRTAKAQTVYLHWMDWRGVPNLTFRRGPAGTTEWKRAWVTGLDHWWTQFPSAFHLSQDRGTGLLIQGTRDWKDYEVTSAVTGSGARGFGIAVYVQGLRRYYALILTRDQRVRLVREKHGTTVLGERTWVVQENQPYRLCLKVVGRRLRAWVDGEAVFSVEDGSEGLESGAVALLIEEGTMTSEEVILRSIGSETELDFC